MKHLTFDESVASRVAWNARCAAEQSTPPVENSNPVRVAPAGADGQGVCTSEALFIVEYVTFSGQARISGALSWPLARALVDSLLRSRASHLNIAELRS